MVPNISNVLKLVRYKKIGRIRDDIKHKRLNFLFTIIVPDLFLIIKNKIIKKRGIFLGIIFFRIAKKNNQLLFVLKYI
jgi:hypothetical protein